MIAKCPPLPPPSFLGLCFKGCFLEWYCSAECQRSDWAHHKEACKARRTGVETLFKYFVKRGVSFKSKCLTC